MIEIIIQGRGGQGAQVAGQMLATAFFKEGKYIQSFASYGGARRGAPVSAFLRADVNQIRLRCNVEQPDAILFFDSSLITHEWQKNIKKNTIILVNSFRSLSEFENWDKGFFYSMDAKIIASKHGLGRIVNSTLIGAFAALLEEPQKDNLIEVVREMSPAKAEENVSSCLEGFQWAKDIKLKRQGSGL